MWELQNKLTKLVLTMITSRCARYSPPTARDVGAGADECGRSRSSRRNHPLSAKDERLLQAAMVNGATDTFSQCDDPAAACTGISCSRN